MADLIYDCLKAIGTSTNADRVVLAPIHTNDFNDYEVYNKVFSVRHEYIRTNGIPSISHLVQNKPISILQLEHDYYKDKFLIIKNNEIDGFPEKCKHHLKILNCHTIINRNVYWLSSIIAILSLQYLTTPCNYNNNNLSDLDDIITPIENMGLVKACVI